MFDRVLYLCIQELEPTTGKTSRINVSPIDYYMLDAKQKTTKTSLGLGLGIKFKSDAFPSLSRLKEAHVAFGSLPMILGCKLRNHTRFADC